MPKPSDAAGPSGAGRPLAEFAARVRASAAQPAAEAVAEVLDALEAASLEPLLLKGPALARELYRDGEHRSYGDIDVLVAPGDLGRARQVLEHIGFENTMNTDDVAGTRNAEIWLGAEGPGVVTLLDLHWRIGGWHAPPQVTWEALTERRREIPLGPRAAWGPGREALALHVATHAAQHGPDNLKAIADLERGIARWDEEVWASARGLARVVEATDALSAGLRLLPEGADLAHRLGVPPADKLTWAIDHRHERPPGTFHLQALQGADTARERVKVVRRALVPSRSWMTWNYPWVQASRLRLAASYVLHLLRAPVWAARAWHYRRRERRAGSGT